MAVSGLLAECYLHRLNDFELVLSVHFSFSSRETVSNSSLLSGGKALGSAPRHKPADCGTGPGGTEPEKAVLGVGLAGTPALRPRRRKRAAACPLSAVLWAILIRTSNLGA